MAQGGEQAFKEQMGNFFAGSIDDRGGVRVGTIGGSDKLARILTVGATSDALIYDKSGNLERQLNREFAFNSGLLDDETTRIIPPPTPRWSINNGVLSVTGTAGNDIITLVFTNGRYSIDNGSSWLPPNTSVIRFEVNGLGGNDSITNLTTVAMVARGGTGNDTLNSSRIGDDLFGEGGNDTLNGSNIIDVSAWRNGVLYTSPFYLNAFGEI